MLRKTESIDEPVPPLPIKKRLRQDDEHLSEGVGAMAASGGQPISGGQPTFGGQPISGQTTSGSQPTFGGQPTSGGQLPTGITGPVFQKAAVAEVSPLVTTVLKPNPVPTPPTEIPVAVAFVETCNAIFRGTSLEQCAMKVSGEMAVAFPANYIDRLLLCPPLQFRVTNTGLVDKVVHHPTLLKK